MTFRTTNIKNTWNNNYKWWQQSVAGQNVGAHDEKGKMSSSPWERLNLFGFLLLCPPNQDGLQFMFLCEYQIWKDSRVWKMKTDKR